MPLFAPRTFRLNDDFKNSMGNVTKLNAFDVDDLGTIPIGSISSDYTNDLHRINEWYRSRLPDNHESRHDTKTIHIKLKYDMKIIQMKRSHSIGRPVQMKILAR